MTITIEQARETIESVFDFDHVGDAMFALRKDFDSVELKEKLVAELVKAACEELDDSSPETMNVITEAAKARADRFVQGSKYSQSGCSGL